MEKAFVHETVEKLNAFFKENDSIVGFKLDGNSFLFDKNNQGWFNWGSQKPEMYLISESHYSSDRVDPFQCPDAKLCVRVIRPGLWASFDEYVNIEVFENKNIVFTDAKGNGVFPKSPDGKEKQIALPLEFFKELFYEHIMSSETYQDILRIKMFSYITKNDPSMEEHFPLDGFEKKLLQTYGVFEKNPGMVGFEYKAERYTLVRRKSWEATVCYDYNSKIWFDNNLRTMDVDKNLNHKWNLRHNKGEQFPNHTQDLGIQVKNPAARCVYFRMSEFLSPETKYF